MITAFYSALDDEEDNPFHNLAYATAMAFAEYIKHSEDKTVAGF